MGFIFRHSDNHQDPTRQTKYPFKSSEVGYANGTVKLVAGEWVKCAPTDAVGGILQNNSPAGQTEAEVLEVRPGDVYEANYTGTPAATFKAGINTVALTANGTAVDAATVAGGPVVVMDINTNKQIAQVQFKNRQFS